MCKITFFIILQITLVGYSWGIFSHEHITKWSLIDITDAKVADIIAEHADEPDCYHDGCPPQRSNLPFCWGAPTKQGELAPCMHGHRISDYLIREDKRFYNRGNIGAEIGASFWASKAREIYRKDPNNNLWKVYLGWATHYLADALCPAHAFPESDRDAYNFWEKGTSSHKQFEAAFDVDFQHPVLSAFLKETLKGRAAASFSTPQDIEEWIKSNARWVYNQRILSIAWDDRIFQILRQIAFGIRGLYNFVTRK